MLAQGLGFLPPPRSIAIAAFGAMGGPLILFLTPMGKKGGARCSVRVFIHSESEVAHCAVAHVVAPEGGGLLCRDRLPRVPDGARRGAFVGKFWALLGQALR